jgi:hypothetical protein
MASLTEAVQSSTSRTSPVLILLGGFLGAGKTTLILTASRILQTRGLKPAAILNDQGSELVDTKHVRNNGIRADQVSGGCFCCRFSDMIDAAERLRAYSPDVIFAEAAGSCTDISATTLQPLKLHYRNEFRLAPYTVLVDPGRALEFSAAGADSDLSYLFYKQIDEADLVCFTRSDLYAEFPSMTGASVRYISPLTGEGIAAWLDEVLGSYGQAGNKILDIEYGRYARAEAGLAWLNCCATIILSEALSPSTLIGPLLDGLDAALSSRGLQIAHLKMVDDCSSGYLKASLVRNGEEPSLQGMLDASPAVVHELLLNVRAAGDHTTLQEIVETELRKISGEVEIRTMECFSPEAPHPEQRLSVVTGQEY